MPPSQPAEGARRQVVRRVLVALACVVVGSSAYRFVADVDRSSVWRALGRLAFVELVVLVVVSA